jgi:hypothetical protein
MSSKFFLFRFAYPIHLSRLYWMGICCYRYKSVAAVFTPFDVVVTALTSHPLSHTFTDYSN